MVSGVADKFTLSFKIKHLYKIRISNENGKKKY